jgi:cyclin-dependent kinase regulatory subunit CKS1
MPHYPKNIEYSEKYYDGYYEYRHVFLPKAIFEKIKKTGTLEEDEWRAIGVQQSKGWVNYARYIAEPHILLFRRPIGTDPNTGEAPLSIKNKYPQYIEEKEKNLAITSEYPVE